MTVDGIQTKLIPATDPIYDAFTSDDWETPLYLAKAMVDILNAELPDAFCGSGCVHPLACDFVLEPGAGNGNIAQFYRGDLPYYAVETKKSRFLSGKAVFPRGMWMHRDFMEMRLRDFAGRNFAVIANPPFSRAVDMLEHLASFEALPRLLVLLLPTTFFQSGDRSKRFAALPFNITREYRLAGRVGYIRDGIPEDRRQCNDSVFVLRPEPESTIKIRHVADLQVSYEEVCR